MADIFFTQDARRLLDKKHIVFVGDSNVRAVYKDLVYLLNTNLLINQSDLKKKQEPRFSGDRLGKHSELNRGRDYEEERSFEKYGIRVDYYFITRCYNAMFEDMMEDIHLGLRDAPDVIFLNSTLWDVNRWGPNGVNQFKDNLQKLARLLKSSLPEKTLVIWATALPVSPSVKSALLLKQIDFLQRTLRFDVMEANHFARQVMVTHGFDVLDLHFHLRMQAHRRGHDGIHYMPLVIRLITNLLLTHIALSWDFPLPNRWQSILLDKAISEVSHGLESTQPKELPKEPKALAPKLKKKAVSNKNHSKKPDKAPLWKSLWSPERRNGQKRPFRRNTIRRGRVKRVGSSSKWTSGESLYSPADQRHEDRWSSQSPTPQTSHNSGNFPPVWSNSTGNFSQVWENNSGNFPQVWENPHQDRAIWSEDHWPDEPSYPSQGFSEPLFRDDCRFISGNSSRGRAARRRQSSLPFQQRYAPY